MIVYPKDFEKLKITLKNLLVVRASER